MDNMDIYFEEKYGESTEFIDEGKTEVFEFESADGKISNMFLLREIDSKLVDGYFDIITPYGYGGPIIKSLTGDKEALIMDYGKSFENYCKQKNIVSEFVRFHPIIANHKDFEGLYDTVFLRKTVATVLKGKEDPFQEEFSKSCRKTVRKVLGEDLTYEIIEKPENLDSFIKIYYDTMDRNEAGDFYYFEREYFQFLLDNLRENILNINIYFEDKCIASGLYFIYNKYIHAHLSGTDHEYLKFSPAYYLKYLTTTWGKEHGYDYVHYGGGTTNDPEDPLFKFKSKFTKEGFFDFYIGKKIHNDEVYNKLVEESGNKQNDSAFFPLYRA